MNQNNLPEMHNPPPPPPLTTETIRWQKYYEIEAVKTAYERDKQESTFVLYAFISGAIVASAIWAFFVFVIAYK